MVAKEKANERVNKQKEYDQLKKQFADPQQVAQFKIDVAKKIYQSGYVSEMELNQMTGKDAIGDLVDRFVSQVAAPI